MNTNSQSANITTTKKERIIAFDVLRFLAAYGVILYHAPGGNMWFEGFPLLGWNITCTYFSLVRWCVPTFVMISGALFLDINKQLSVKRLYSKNVVRIVYAYLFWSLVFVMITPELRTNIKDVIIGVFRGPLYLWFLKMLFGLYVIIPLLREIVRNKKVEEYFLLFTFVTVNVIPFCIEIIGRISGPVMELLVDSIRESNLDKVMGFSGYFVLGHYLHNRIFSDKQAHIIYLLAIIGFLCVVTGTYTYSHVINYPDNFILDMMTPFNVFETVAVFVFAKRHFIKYSPSVTRWILDLSACSFGIYLVHPIILGKLRPFFDFDPNSYWPLLGIPLLTLIVFIVAYAIIKVMKLIPILGKYVM
ncbi:MAG: acyltransferase family protein [Prevotella sp.]|nr:acyltransferase family protein [Prevotella sp.]